MRHADAHPGGTQLVKTGKAMPFGRLHAANDPNSPSQPAASTASLGQGKIAATYFLFQPWLFGPSLRRVARLSQRSHAPTLPPSDRRTHRFTGS